MSENVISFREAKAKRLKPVCSYFVRVDLYEDGIGGEVQILDMNAADLRGASENLFALARHVRDLAFEQSGDPDDKQLSVTRIYESSRVNCWTSNEIDTPDRAEWLARRFEEAAEASAPDCAGDAA